MTTQQLIPGKLYSTLYSRTYWSINSQKYIGLAEDTKILFVKSYKSDITTSGLTYVILYKEHLCEMTPFMLPSRLFVELK